MQGRRVKHPNDIERPGDYCGPIEGFTGRGTPAVFFLKPNARDDDAPPPARSMQHVTAPPHRFEEHDDGTVTISPSISEFKRHGPKVSDGWRGYLERGVWRQV